MHARDVKTADDARRIVDARGLSHVKVGAFDMDGVLRGKYMAAEKFLSALDGHFGFCDVVLGWDSHDQLYDNVAFTGWHTGYPDAQVRILADSCREIPWEDGMLFFLSEFAGEAEAVCPRACLRRVVDRAAGAGLTPYAAAEYEFFLFEETPHSIREKGYRGMRPITPGFSARARVLIYNRNIVPQGQEPKSIMDLLDKRFEGRACIANPLFGTTSMHAAALFSVLGEEKAKAFFEGFVANGGKILSSNGEVRRRVAAGEFAVGITDTDDANVARLEGKPVGVVYPDREGMGTLIIPNCTVLIAGSPNPGAARKLIDYLHGAQTEEALAKSAAALIPLRPGVRMPDGSVSLLRLTPMEVNYAALADLLRSLSAGYLKQWVDRSSG